MHSFSTKNKNLSVLEKTAFNIILMEGVRAHYFIGIDWRVLLARYRKV